MATDDYETQGHTEVFVDTDGSLQSDGAPVDPLKLPAEFDASALPVADPHVAGHVWRNAGVLTVSAG